MAHFPNFSPYLTKICPSKCQRGPFGIGNEIMEPSVKEMGNFLRKVNADVLKEESDILAELDLEPKQVNSAVSKIARLWFQDKLDKYIFSK